MSGSSEDPVSCLHLSRPLFCGPTHLSVPLALPRSLITFAPPLITFAPPPAPWPSPPVCAFGSSAHSLL